MKSRIVLANTPPQPQKKIMQEYGSVEQNNSLGIVIGLNASGVVITGVDPKGVSSGSLFVNDVILEIDGMGIPATVNTIDVNQRLKGENGTFVRLFISRRIPSTGEIVRKRFVLERGGTSVESIERSKKSPRNNAEKPKFGPGIGLHLRPIGQNGLPVVVSIDLKGPVYRCGRIRPGDAVEKVNGVDTMKLGFRGTLRELHSGDVTVTLDCVRIGSRGGHPFRSTFHVSITREPALPRMKLQPISPTNRDKSKVTIGAAFTEFNKTPIIKTVVDGGPLAQTCMAQVGDFVCHVNGIDVQGFPFVAWKHLLEGEPGTYVILGLRNFDSGLADVFTVAAERVSIEEIMSYT